MPSPLFPAATYPTPLTRCDELSAAHAELWIKNDGLTHPVYGGNKVRKAERLIQEARRRGARRILTIGAVGSHHVLTMALFAKAAGLGCAAVLIQQPRSEHVVETIRAALGQGLEPLCTRWQVGVPFAVLGALRRHDFFVPPGGSNLLGSVSYADAVAELARQLTDAGLAPPDCIVVPLGSGGTVAGIAAGVAQHGLPSRVIGVQVVPGPMPRVLARQLSRRTLHALNPEAPRQALARILTIDPEQLGGGYGVATAEGTRASLLAARFGLKLDQTYTAKAFAAVLRLLEGAKAERAAGGAPLRVLYWHTLSATPIEPLLSSAPTEPELPAAVKALLDSA